MELGGAGQCGTNLYLKPLILEGLMMLSSRVLPDHCAVLGRECHATPLNADGSMSAGRLMGGRLCQSQAHTGDQCRRSQGECFHTGILLISASE